MGFRDLERYERNKARFEKYKAWLAMNPTQRQQAYAAITVETERAKAERTDGYVATFNSLGSGLTYINAQILSASQTGQGGALANIVRGLLEAYTVTATEYGALTTPTSIEVKKYKYAKLALTTVVPVTTPSYSRITGAGYKKPKVDTVSSPFGRANAGQTYAAAVDAIKGITAYTNHINGNSGKNRAKFTPEG